MESVYIEVTQFNAASGSVGCKWTEPLSYFWTLKAAQSVLFLFALVFSNCCYYFFIQIQIQWQKPFPSPQLINASAKDYKYACTVWYKVA